MRRTHSVRAAAAARSRWSDLERDWKSVVLGAAVVAATGVFRVPIPW